MATSHRSTRFIPPSRRSGRRASGAGKVKVAVNDIDGVLRGKLLHKDKFFSVAEPYPNGGFCDVVPGWDMLDDCYDNTAVTGWQHGFPDALARLDLATYRSVPWEDNVPFFLGEFFKALMDEMLAIGIPIESLHTETGPGVNPYLAMAAVIAAGLDGVEKGLKLTAPRTRVETNRLFQQSDIARDWEWRQWLDTVTDGELKRYIKII